MWSWRNQRGVCGMQAWMFFTLPAHFWQAWWHWADQALLVFVYYILNIKSYAQYKWNTLVLTINMYNPWPLDAFRYVAVGNNRNNTFTWHEHSNAKDGTSTSPSEESAKFVLYLTNMIPSRQCAVKWVILALAQWPWEYPMNIVTRNIIPPKSILCQHWWSCCSGTTGI